MIDTRAIIWALTEARNALREGEVHLANRYLEKSLDQVRCVYCHEPLDEEKPYHVHFKGYRHDECAQYHGRGDYLRQHPEAEE